MSSVSEMISAATEIAHLPIGCSFANLSPAEFFVRVVVSLIQFNPSNSHRLLLGVEEPRFFNRIRNPEIGKWSGGD